MTQAGCSTLEPYALRVLGDSMEPEFPEGCVVIVDPGHVAHDGSYVIVEFADRLAAEQNDQLPATGQVAGRIAELATAGPEFVNLDVRRLDED